MLAYRRPDAKLVVVANRGFAEHTLEIGTGNTGKTFRGFRYTPKEARDGFLGVPIGSRTGCHLSSTVPDMAWEFRIEQ